MANLHYRSVFISDVHLGTSDCQIELLLEFLGSTSSDYLYLVGDIFDFWKLHHAIVWSRVNNEVMNLVMEKARNGTRVIYIPGNHDELMRDFIGIEFNGIELRRETVHKTVTGKRLLILHGDVFDEAVRNYRFLETLGRHLYQLIMTISCNFNRVRKRLGYGYWSFANFIKYRFKEAVRFIENFEKTAAGHAARLGFDGIVCGHIHHPNNLTLSGVKYLNTGDWVEHCTALTEDVNGHLEIVEWLKFREQVLPPIEDGVAARHAA